MLRNSAGDCFAMGVSMMMFLLSVLHIFASVEGTWTMDPASCGPNGVLYKNECLYIFIEKTKWLDADMACKRFNGARLATITDQEMNDVLTGHIQSDSWIGLHDTHEEGNWRWVDETPVNYTNFQGPIKSVARSDIDAEAQTEAKEDVNCVALLSGTGVWRDERCSEIKGRICALPRSEPLCQDGGTFFRDRCYWYGGVMSWDMANRYCEETFGDGVKLVIVRDAKLNTFLSRHVHPGIFLGLRYIESEGIWRWVDGSPLDANSYEKWRKGELDDMRGEKNYAYLNQRSESWTRELGSPFTRFVCALQTCYDQQGTGSGGRYDTDEEVNCLDFGDVRECACVANALCRRNGRCHCEKLFDGMKCDTDELKVTIQGPNPVTDLGSNTTLRCHVNLPPTDVDVRWEKVSGNKMFPGGRTSLQNHPEVGNFDLVIERLQEDDTGLYVCVATTTNDFVLEITYLHVASDIADGDDVVRPDTGTVFNPDGTPSKETGWIIAVAAVSICLACILLAIIVVKGR